jgi:hypothetical protein
VNKRSVLAAMAAAVAVLGASCFGGSLRGVQTASPSAASPRSRPTTPVLQADPLCRPLPRPTQTGPTVGSLPPDISRVADQVESVRQLRFTQPVVPEPLSPSQIQQQLQDTLSQQYAADVVAGEERTDITVGALPAGTDLRQVLIDFGTSQIVGFYDTSAKRLVFEGGTQPTPFERFTLAHELTHALQDQHFDLSQLDRLNDVCQDEPAEAFLSLAEGDAVQTQLAWARANLSAGEIAELQQEAGSFPPPPPTPPFVQQFFEFPYSFGQPFVEALQNRGGERAVDDAFANPPVSTEQILHPEKYPDDVPQAVNIPDLSSRLGQGWSLVDQQEVGEAWLRIVLQLRLSAEAAANAAAGWDGGLLRSWGDGSKTAVLMETVWDSPQDAEEFGAAMNDWFDHQAAAATQNGAAVQVRFASNAETLSTLADAIAG